MPLLLLFACWKPLLLNVRRSMRLLEWTRPLLLLHAQQLLLVPLLVWQHLLTLLLLIKHCLHLPATLLQLLLLLLQLLLVSTSCLALQPPIAF
jgi:hypothetical protein